MIDCRYSYLPGHEEVQVLPDKWRQAEDCIVVGGELSCVEERGDPGVGLPVLNRAEGFAKCEFSEHCSSQAL